MLIFFLLIAFKEILAIPLVTRNFKIILLFAVLSGQPMTEVDEKRETQLLDKKKAKSFQHNRVM